MNTLKLKHASFWDESTALKANSIDLILTDPPYMSYSARGAGRTKSVDKIEGVFNPEAFVYFAVEAFRLLKPDRHIYVFTQHGDPYISTYNALKTAGFSYNQTLLWTKINFTKTGDFYGTYPPQCEVVLFCEKPGKDRRKLNGRVHSNLLTEFASVPSERMVHPTQKPVGLLSFLIERSTQENELVLDPFVGSGSCLFGCRNTSRSFLGYEIVEKYLKQIAFQLSVGFTNSEIVKTF